MYIKLISRDLNPNSYPPHSSNTYTCGMTIAIRMHDDTRITILITLVYQTTELKSSHVQIMFVLIITRRQKETSEGIE